MPSVVARVSALCGQAIRAAFPTLAKPPVLVLPAKKGADYQCNSAMAISQVGRLFCQLFSLTLNACLCAGLESNSREECPT